MRKLENDEIRKLLTNDLKSNMKLKP